MDSAATKVLNCKMAEYTKAVVDGRPNFHISLIVDVSPNCDCHPENDAPILPNIGMFASFDPLALDQACADVCLSATPLPHSQLADRMEEENFCDHHDHLRIQHRIQSTRLVWHMQRRSVLEQERMN